MARQKAIALQIYIKQGKEDDVKQKISELGNPSNVMQPSMLSHESFPKVHFMRFLVAPATTIKGKDIGASLLYSANLDSSVEEHYKDLATTIGEFLHELFLLCEGYDFPEFDKKNLIPFMQAHFLKTPAFYVGAPNRSVDRIHMEDQLRRDVAEFVNTTDKKMDSPVATLNAIHEWLASDANKDRYTLSETSSKTPRIWWIPAFFTLIIACILLIFMGVIIFPFIHFFYERRNKPLGLDLNQLNAAELEKKEAAENTVYQNQLSQVFITKGGLRRFVLWVNLRLTQILANNIFVKGKLLGTPTIHFARWMMIDGGKRFVFFSNFDGSYDEYLGDFVDNSGWGLNAIYGASEGYPTTFWGLGGGAYKIAQFLGWGRYWQVETQAWYSAYPNLGLSQIINNSLLREGLYKGRMSSKKIERLLRRI